MTITKFILRFKIDKFTRTYIQIKWWDTRKLQSPLETLVIDLIKPEDQDLDRAIGVSALQFESSIGTRFMCGLENG